MKFYILLAIIVLAFGFNTSLAVKAFQGGYYFNFGVNLAFDIYWILKLIELIFKGV